MIKVFVCNIRLSASKFVFAILALMLVACSVDPLPVFVEGVSISADCLTLIEGESDTLSVSITPSDAWIEDVKWESSDTFVASIDYGVVKAKNAGTATITVTTVEGHKTDSCTVTVVVPVRGISLNKTSLTLPEGNSETLTATINPSNATNQNVTWNSSDTSVATVDASGKVTAVKAGTATITVTTKDGGKTATCSVTVKSAGPEAVDLGLSVKWASFNIGASKPEEYGDYYAWGETEPESNYDWSTYKWCNGSSSSLTKYCTDSSDGTVDNRTVLELEDDVAHVKWGGSWRMPTDPEFKELRDNCTWTWTTQNGVDGYKVSSKTNGNSIFLPAAGHRSNTDLDRAGTFGYYWSSSLSTYYSYSAYSVYFFSSYVDRSYKSRYYGQSVRPVSE